MAKVTTKHGVKKMSVSLYPREIQVVKGYSDVTGAYNFSAALRMIINEWYERMPIDKEAVA